jgi:hypothetical protein
MEAACDRLDDLRAALLPGATPLVVEEMDL